MKKKKGVSNKRQINLQIWPKSNQEVGKEFLSHLLSSAMKMIRIRWYLFLLCLLVGGSTVEGKRRLRYTLKFHNFDCVNSWSVVKNLSCVIAEDGTINTDFTLLEPLPVLWINGKLSVVRPAQRSEMVIFNTTFDACKLFSDGSMGNKLVTSMYQAMMKSTNFVRECPIRKGMLYFNNMANLDNFPAFMPEMDFKIYILFFKPNTAEHIDVFLNGSLVEIDRLRQRLWK